MKRLTLFFINITLFITFFAAMPAIAAKIKNVAVVEAIVDAHCGTCNTIEKYEVGQITAELRRVARVNLPSDRYRVMTKETIQAQSEEVLQECLSENCIIKMGEKIGAEYIVKSAISRFGPKFTLSIEMYETKDGNLVAALVDPIRSDNLIDILEKISPVCATMFKKFVSEQNPQSTPPPTPQPPPTPYQPQVNQQPPAPPPQPIYQPPSPAPTPTPAAPVGATVSGTTFTDSRDGKTYKTAVIGGKRWMAENLNYQPQTGNSWCYGDDVSNCGKYGRLYDWNTAQIVCPKGYHLPSREEWQRLVDSAGGNRTAGRKLKARSGWDDYKGRSNGTDKFGFSALPGGARSKFGGFNAVGKYGYWWTATDAFTRFMYYRGDDSVYEGVNLKGIGFSVRCVADATHAPTPPAPPPQPAYQPPAPPPQPAYQPPAPAPQPQYQPSAPPQFGGGGSGQDRNNSAKYTSENNTQMQTLVNAGNAFFNQQNYSEAEANYNKAIKLYEKNRKNDINPALAAQAYFMVGQVYYKKFDSIKLNAKNEKEMVNIIKQKTKALEDPAKYFAKTIELGVDEWTMIATYMIGRGFYDMADAAANQTLFGNETEKMAAKIQVMRTLGNYYDKAIEYFSKNITWAKQRNVTGQYIEMSKQSMMEMAFRKGDILEQVGLIFRNSPVPKGLSGEDREFYIMALEEKYLKALDAAMSEYEDAMKMAKQMGIANSPWIDRIRERLGAIKPDSEWYRR